ncbi:MAG: LCP family protein [Actinomycetota bacterium]|nr:LCP family protein [Actinomycetota bacterium]
MTSDSSGDTPLGARTRQRQEVRRGARRSARHTLAAIIPGAGLIGTRYRRFGWLLLTVLVLAVVALALTLVAKGATTTALSLAVRPDLLLTVAGVATIGGLVWIFSIILTHRGTMPARADRSSRFGLRALTALMCLLVALPAFQVVRYSLIQRDVVSSVFGDLPSKTVAGNSGGSNPGSTVSPDESAPDPWAGVQRVNMLLIGSDAGSDRVGVRTDSMVVASMDPQNGNTVLVSVPRNLERAPFPTTNPLYKLYPNGYYCPGAAPGAECMINAVWTLAEGNRGLFPADPNPGLTTIRDVIGATLGVTIDYTTVIDLSGFEALVQAMGGVTVNVTERLPINGYHPNGNPALIAGVEGWIEPGVQKLDGYHALWFARSRLISDDYSRMRRQRCLIGALVGQVNPVSMLSKYPELAQVAKQNISTDVQVAQLPAWVDLIQRVQKGTITSLTFTDEVINSANPNFTTMRTLVEEALSAATQTATTSSTTTTATPSTTTTAPPTVKSGPKSSKTTAPKTTTSATTTTVTAPPGSIVDIRSAC